PIRKTQGREVDFIPITPLSGYVDLHISFRNPALGENENSFSLEWFAFRKTLPGSDLSGYKSIKNKFRQLLRSDPDGIPVIVESTTDMNSVNQLFEKCNSMSLGDTVNADVPEILTGLP